MEQSFDSAPPVSTPVLPTQPAVPDGLRVGMKFLCWLIPLIGIIIFVTSHNTLPKKAKSALISAIVGVVCYVVISVALDILISLSDYFF
jgi:hypothetical protein